MYESPIDVFVTQMNVERNRFIENEILTAVQGVGVHVDKHELKKALLYDRGQYKEGYADGVREFAEKLKEKADSNEIWVAGKTFTFYMIREDYLDNLVKEMVGE